jgi:hypothetical protein
VVVYFGQFYENYRSSQSIFATFFHDVSCSQMLTKKLRWATFWAIFFTNSSGHPASNPG